MFIPWLPKPILRASSSLQLTVRDSQGLSTTTYVDLRPQVVTLSFNTNPSGLTINVARQPKITPYSFQTVAGVLISLSTASPQTLNGTSYTFSNWQNGLGTGGTITAYYWTKCLLGFSGGIK